jgi:mono/diheme cytochrome c family protein
MLMAGAASVVLFAVAQPSTPTIKTVPIQQTNPTSGRQMYVAYCAACHGAEGQGNGPAASALKIPPSDLTLLSQKNKGAFPSSRVYSVIEFGAPTPAHGSAEMPVWGTLMLSLHSVSSDNREEVSQRIGNLTNYVKGLQK